MAPFEYIHPATLDAAIAAGQDARAKFIGGGTNLVDLMKGGVERPARLIDINHLQLDVVQDLPGGGLHLGAAARNSDVANHPAVRERYPLLAQALLAGASPQLRNMATVGGNLMQRTRCDYFVDTAYAQCNKRNPGSGCAARAGYNRGHAILGASEHCVAVNPSDMNVALLALNAVVVVRGPKGERRIAIDDFHRLPGDNPERDTSLGSGELILGVELQRSGFVHNYHYLKVRERASYAFALVSVAVGMQITAGAILDARIALGGVAHKPWLANEAGAVLVGKSVGNVDLDAVAAASVQGAQPLSQNAYKIQLAKNAVVRAVKKAMEVA
jgi:xanthine dehydrogenase YagS FAD-binding subunit